MPSSFAVQRLSVGDPDSVTILSLESTPDAQWAAACTSSGQVLFNGCGPLVGRALPTSANKASASTGANTQSFVYNPSGLLGGSDAVATTAIAFSPVLPSAGGGGGGGGTKYAALVAMANGAVVQALIDAGSSSAAHGSPDSPTMRVHKELSRSREEGNEVLACGYDRSGTIFVTGGSDTKLRVYDTETAAVISTITKSIGSHGQDTAGHNSRIYSIKFLDSMCFLSSGWESSMMLHDTRVRKAVRVYEGVHMSGDGIALLDGGLVAAASDRGKDQLQIFNIGSGQQVLPSITTPMNLFSCRSDGHGALWAVGSQPGGAVKVQAADGAILETIAAPLIGEASLYGIAPLFDGTVYAGGAKGTLYRMTVA